MSNPSLPRSPENHNRLKRLPFSFLGTNWWASGVVKSSLLVVTPSYRHHSSQGRDKSVKEQIVCWLHSNYTTKHRHCNSRMLYIDMYVPCRCCLGWRGVELRSCVSAPAQHEAWTARCGCNKDCAAGAKTKTQSAPSINTQCEQRNNTWNAKERSYDISATYVDVI